MFKRSECNAESPEKKRGEIECLGLDAIRSYFKIDISKLDDKTIHQLHAKARLAMSFEKELNVSKRAIEMNYLRVFRLIAEDKKELKQLIRKSLPKYLK